MLFEYSRMFSWNKVKSVSNLKKHGVSFEEATTVFFDPNALDFDDLKHSKNEKRSLRLGKNNIKVAPEKINLTNKMQGNESNILKTYLFHRSVRVKKQTFSRATKKSSFGCLYNKGAKRW